MPDRWITVADFVTALESNAVPAETDAGEGPHRVDWSATIAEDVAWPIPYQTWDTGPADHPMIRAVADVSYAGRYTWQVLCLKYVVRQLTAERRQRRARITLLPGGAPP